MRNRAFGASEFNSQFSEAHSRLAQCSYFKNLFFSQQGTSLLLSLRSIMRRIKLAVVMKLIFRARKNLKVFKVIELLCTVFMVHIHFRRDRSDKCLNYKPVNQSDFSLSIGMIKQNVKITMHSGSGTQNAILSLAETTHISLVANFVAAFKTEHGFPSLHHIGEGLYHSATL